MTNAEESEDPMLMCTNASDRKMKLIAEIMGKDHKCWANKESIATAVSFESLNNQCRITYDNATEITFLVCTDDRIVKFTRTKEVLCRFRFSKEHLENIKNPKGKAT